MVTEINNNPALKKWDLIEENKQKHIFKSLFWSNLTIDQYFKLHHSPKELGNEH